jgi:hypothetical protein
LAIISFAPSILQSFSGGFDQSGDVRRFRAYPQNNPHPVRQFQRSMDAAGPNHQPPRNPLSMRVRCVGVSAAEIAGSGAPYPGFVEPILAGQVDRPRRVERWIHEIEFDGYCPGPSLSPGAMGETAKPG